MSPLPHHAGSNPLLDHLYHPIDMADIARRLAFDPLKGLDVQSMPLMSRLELLDGDKMPLRPTVSSLRIAATIINMVRSSYRNRNPCTAQGRRAVNQSIEFGRNTFAGAPVLGTSAFVIKGIAGVAKTVTVKHTLSLLGPQVVIHDDRPDAMWLRATQLIWLYVSMSHDGTRGGLLNNILIAVDIALGGDRGARLQKQHRTVERLAGAVIALLHSLYIGALVIDEIQLGNLVQAEQSHKMHLFLLNLINSGIPVILVGNPAGFVWLSRLSQDATRLAAIPPVFVHPAESVDGDDDRWAAIYDGVSSYYVMDEPPTDAEVCQRVLLKRSGGIARCALTLWCNAQRQALIEGRTWIDADDIEAAYQSDAFADVRGLCDGFARKDVVPLMRWADTDVPVDYYAKRWGFSNAATDPQGSSSNAAVALGGSTGALKAPGAMPAKKVRAQRSPQAQMRSAETRAAKREQARHELASKLQPDDMRADGIKKHTLTAFNELMASLESDPGSR